MECNTKKLWKTPELIQYGAVADLTQAPKLKTPGSADDFEVPGISNP